MVEKTTKAAFDSRIVVLPISCITPQRELTAKMKKTACYKQICTSLENVGLIEPLVVFEQPQGVFLLLDGNTRFAIMKANGALDVACILARDDESYTYNRRVSHIPPILQHYMLLRVLENGVTEERIAAALNINVRTVCQKRDMLKGICPEVVRLLEARRLGARSFSALRKMKPLRQIETAEYMIANNNFTLPFIMAILSMTKPEMLMLAPSIDSSEEVSHALLEREHEGLVRDLRAVEMSFGIDMLTLAVSVKYLERLLNNVKVKRYLEGTSPELFVILVGLTARSADG
jgi:hypothetical protein